MRWSQTLIPTLKETPADAEIISHKLLLRAGLVRKLTGGLYTFLPLGVRVLRKVEQIVREEMNRAGALEVYMPALHPPELWQKTGRYATMQGVLFHAKDSAGREWVLGPTHEEVITSLMADEISSNRHHPKNFYQIQKKYPDENRPRFGLMRAKEFVMKDAYSFDATDEAASASYQKMYDAYTRLFQRCGLKCTVVEADTGVMGGKFSHEFMVPAETGENEVVLCDGCGYAASMEKAVSKLIQDTGVYASPVPLEKFPTPGVVTIEALSQPPHNVPAEKQIKTLVFLADSKPVLILMRGDHQLNEAKLTGALGTATFRPATSEEIFDLLGAHPGSLGAVGVTKVPVFADEALGGTNLMTTGANEDGFHLRHVNLARDITVTKWAELRTVRAGEPCLHCEKPLQVQRAIEVGHVFKLGTKYSKALNACFLNEAGGRELLIMGCYGIGVTRTVQAIIEQSNDRDGIIWPATVAPFHVCLCPLNVTPGGPVMSLAERLYGDLTARGVEVLLDDRDERPGVKFKDADLIGFPLRLTIGEKGLAKGEVEVKVRGGVMHAVKPEEAVEKVSSLLGK
ncbi:MAG: proline--tRNA ligase [Verrucomicrobia bacterium]|nr:proline--tRNA ligase [Verrucomicrobiota bacterium]